MDFGKCPQNTSKGGIHHKTSITQLGQFNTGYIFLFRPAISTFVSTEHLTITQKSIHGREKCIINNSV